MPRTEGRTLTAIWRDDDFVALPARPQRTYWFLTTQQDLNHAGLIPLRIRSWSTRYLGGTTDELREDLQALVDAGLVAVDEDTEELLLRHHVRRDRVYRMPKVMERLAIDAAQIMSPRLRELFCEDLRSLPLNELTGNQQDVALKVITQLLVLFGWPPPSLTGPSAQPLPAATPKALEAVPDTHADTHPDTAAGGHGEHPAEPIPVPPSRAGARSLRPPSSVLQPPSSVLRGLAARLTGRGTSEPTDDDIARWQTLAGPHADLEREAAAFLEHNSGRDLRNPAGAWRGWLEAAAKRTRPTPTPGAVTCPRHPGRPAGARACPDCETERTPPPADFRPRRSETSGAAQ